MDKRKTVQQNTRDTFVHIFNVTTVQTMDEMNECLRKYVDKGYEAEIIPLSDGRIMIRFDRFPVIS